MNTRKLLAAATVVASLPVASVAVTTPVEAASCAAQITGTINGRSIGMATCQINATTEDWYFYLVCVNLSGGYPSYITSAKFGSTRYNQSLTCPSTKPRAIDIEARVVHDYPPILY